MAGHSHFANIAHKKALVDSKRGKIWTKCARAIMVAARLGGGDPDTNARLRLAISDAKSARMPKDTIERAVRKGSGEVEGGAVEELLYEGYAPGGVAVLCEILTDNRNRTAPEVRKIFELNDGKLGATGCVAWMFERRGLFLVPADKIGEDALMEIALEAGADDVQRQGDKFEVTCDPDVYSALEAALEKAGVEPEMKKVTRVPTNNVELDVEGARKVLKLLEALDDHDDVQSVSSNFSVPDEALAALAEG
jgi:YebC/PmpR family DNA-binding regulatory protein